VENTSIVKVTSHLRRRTIDEVVIQYGENTLEESGVVI
jgi:hypothetical protein